MTLAAQIALEEAWVIRPVAAMAARYLLNGVTMCTLSFYPPRLECRGTGPGGSRHQVLVLHSVARVCGSSCILVTLCRHSYLCGFSLRCICCIVIALDSF